MTEFWKQKEQTDLSHTRALSEDYEWISPQHRGGMTLEMLKEKPATQKNAPSNHPFRHKGKTKFCLWQFDNNIPLQTSLGLTNLEFFGLLGPVCSFNSPDLVRQQERREVMTTRPASQEILKQTKTLILKIQGSTQLRKIGRHKTQGKNWVWSQI